RARRCEGPLRRRDHRRHGGPHPAEAEARRRRLREYPFVREGRSTRTGLLLSRIDSRDMPPPTMRLEGDLVAIDCMMAGMDSLVAAYVVPGEHVAVIETGPATVASTLPEGLRSLG